MLFYKKGKKKFNLQIFFLTDTNRYKYLINLSCHIDIKIKIEQILNLFGCKFFFLTSYEYFFFIVHNYTWDIVVV